MNYHSAIVALSGQNVKDKQGLFCYYIPHMKSPFLSKGDFRRGLHRNGASSLNTHHLPRMCATVAPAPKTAVIAAANAAREFHSDCVAIVPINSMRFPLVLPKTLKQLFKRNRPKGAYLRSSGGGKTGKIGVQNKGLCSVSIEDLLLSLNHGLLHHAMHQPEAGRTRRNIESFFLEPLSRLGSDGDGLI